MNERLERLVTAVRLLKGQWGLDAWNMEWLKDEIAQAFEAITAEDLSDDRAHTLV